MQRRSHPIVKAFGTVVLALMSLTALPAWAQSPSVRGEVTKLDKAGGRITLKHGEIKNLDMPAMTMVFRVADPKLLDQLAVGQTVSFTAEKINGQYTVTTLSKAP